jgi:hypothetical protein
MTIAMLPGFNQFGFQGRIVACLTERMADASYLVSAAEDLLQGRGAAAAGHIAEMYLNEDVKRRFISAADDCGYGPAATWSLSGIRIVGASLATIQSSADFIASSLMNARGEVSFVWGVSSPIKDEAVGFEQPLGVWEGTISTFVDGATQPPRVVRFEIGDECPATELCLHVLAVPEPALHPPGESEHEGYSCFGDDIDTYCFKPVHDNTLDYFGHGILWAENATLHRVQEGTGTAPQGQIAYRSGPPGSSTEIKLLDLVTGDTSVLVGSRCSYSCGLSWSPDGTRLAYTDGVQDDQGKLAPQVVVLEVATGTKTVVVQPEKTAFVLLDNYWGYGDVHWSPDGEWVFYLAGDGRASGEQLRAVPSQGGESRTIKKPGGSFDFDVSADGVIVIREWFNGYDGHGLFLARQDGTIYETLIDPKQQFTLCCAQWSPDARTIAFSAPSDYLEQGMLGPLHVWIINADGTEPHQITFEDRYSDSILDWSPDGSWLVVLRKNGEVSSSFELWLVSSDGGTHVNLSDSVGSDVGGAAWRP